MKITEVLRAIMKDTKTTQSRLVELVESKYPNSKIKTQSAVAQRLRRQNISFDTLLEMTEVMGYEIVIQPKSTRGKRAFGSYVADNKDE